MGKMKEIYPKTGTVEWREMVLKESGNAYQKWTKSEDRLLMKRVSFGWTIHKIAEAHGRRTGTISSRIAKLESVKAGVVEPLVSKSNPRKVRRNEKMSNEASEEMKRRIASGEFGNPKRPDMQAVNDAWSDILETKLKEVGKDGTFNTISGLWPRKGDKVAFDGRTQEEMTIPAGSKILCFYGNPEPNSRQPEYRLTYVTYDD